MLKGKNNDIVSTLLCRYRITFIDIDINISPKVGNLLAEDEKEKPRGFDKHN